MMKELDNELYESIYRYFKVLSQFGYKSYEDVNRLLVMLYISDILSEYQVAEEDLRTLQNCMYCMYGTTCLVPYPKTSIHSVLPSTDTMEEMAGNITIL